jgi:hypothetical protein
VVRARRSSTRAPKEREEQPLRALLGDQYEEIVAESSEFETGASDRTT